MNDPSKTARVFFIYPVRNNAPLLLAPMEIKISNGVLLRGYFCAIIKMLFTPLDIIFLFILGKFYISDFLFYFYAKIIGNI